MASFPGKVDNDALGCKGSIIAGRRGFQPKKKKRDSSLQAVSRSREPETTFAQNDGVCDFLDGETLS
jgi:hypothetical protein